jgi:outer membrane protein assembly factor BamB
LDIHTGRELWTFYANGPVRLAPVGWQGKVYFASDDGYVYCVSAEDGSLRWKFRGAPSERKALGNRRVISAWPARGGPVIRDGTLYFAASIWPFMGTFIHALDAATGKIVWTNDGMGAHYIKQPHNAPAFAGVAPQGAMVATEKYLIVPGGRSVPAVLDRKTGELVYFHIAEGGKGTGGSFVVANESEFFVHTRDRGVRSFEMPTGKKGEFTTSEPVLGGNVLFSVQDHPAALAKLRRAEEKVTSAEYALTRAKSKFRLVEEGTESSSSKKTPVTAESAEQDLAKAQAALELEKKAQATVYAGPVLQAIGPDRKVQWELPVDTAGDLIRAGDRFYVGGSNRVLAVAPPQAGTEARVVWSQAVDGQVMRLLAANGYLFAVTLDGRILAFGRKDQAAVTVRETPALISPAPEFRQRAQAILAQAGTSEGYALCYGVGDGQLLDALLAESQLHITAVDPDGAKVEALRRRYDAAGLYGTRVALHVGDARSFQAPPYIASLVIVGDETASGLSKPGQLKAMFESVRPYGGVLWIPGGGPARRDLASWLEAAGFPQARAHWDAAGATVRREGALPGSADWTHQYGNVANTVKSDDRIVKLPLGVLWFGGNTHTDVLPRHGHGPSEQVVGGRLFIQGMDCVSARDVYTGRVLWKTTIPELDTYGVYWDATYLDVPVTTLYSQVHIPGANARGANYVATADAVYVVTRSECQVLDSRTGKIIRAMRMPARASEAKSPEWGYLGLYQDVLLGGAGFAHYTKKLAPAEVGATPAPPDLAASEGLVAFDRDSGKVLWRAEARHSFWHNGIVAGNGRVYCLDRLPKSAEGKLKRRGLKPPEDYRIVAFDIRTGRLLWETTTNVFGTWLGYSETHDRLLQAGASASDRLGDEASKGMITYRGADGSVAWEKLELAYTGPCILHNDLIITSANSYKNSSGAFSLLDGKPHLIPNPLTGKMEPWQVHRTYGCNYIVASENLLTFRAGAAGFYDLETHAGTGNLGGFKSGCSPNLIVANGVLNAPDYTRTCSCAYQNQTSLAFVHMPELEVWTYSLFGTELTESEPITRLGLNLGAPGDRRSETGTLWLEYPFIGGASANLDVTLNPARPEFFLRHASQVAGAGPAWVVASGVRDIQSITIAPRVGKAALAETPRKEKGASEKSGGVKSTSAIPAGVRPAAEATVGKSSLPTPAQAYTVRLYFAEPDDLQPGQRVFDVSLQDRPVLSNFDIVREAGGALRGVVREFKHIRVGPQLTVGLKPATSSKHRPVLSGVEMIAEDIQLAAQSSPAGSP